MYANGEGVEQSFTTAREWFQKAATLGHKNAIVELKRLDEHIRSTTTTTDDKKQTASRTSHPEEEDKDECPICFELLDKHLDVAILECRHEFHLSCLTKWYKKPKTQYKCPCCYVPRNILTIHAAKKPKKQPLQVIYKKPIVKKKIKRNRNRKKANCIIS